MLSPIDELAASFEAQYGLLCEGAQRQRLSLAVSAAVLARGGCGGDAALTPEEQHRLIAQLTTSESSFFREPSSLDACLERALIERLSQSGGERRVRILSAGCGAGEELYSLAIRIAERHPEALRERLLLKGVDVHGAALAQARQGVYSATALRSLPARLRARYFHKQGDSYTLCEAIRSRVVFEERNLLEPGTSLGSGQFDIIFCRNVLVYMSERAVRLLLSRLDDALAHGGFLFLGQKERSLALLDGFEALQSHEAVYYRKGWPNAAPRERTPRAPSYDTALSDEVARQPRPGKPPAATPSSLSRAVSMLIASEHFAETQAVLDHLRPGALPFAEECLLRTLLLFAQGQSRERRGDRAGALEFYQQALEIDPTLALPALRIGVLEGQRGSRELARHALEQAAMRLPYEPLDRLILFGGGAPRDALLAQCQRELRSLHDIG